MSRGHFLLASASIFFCGAAHGLALTQSRPLAVIGYAVLAGLVFVLNLPRRTP